MNHNRHDVKSRCRLVANKKLVFSASELFSAPGPLLAAAAAAALSVWLNNRRPSFAAAAAAAAADDIEARQTDGWNPSLDNTAEDDGDDDDDTGSITLLTWGCRRAGSAESSRAAGRCTTQSDIIPLTPQR